MAGRETPTIALRAQGWCLAGAHNPGTLRSIRRPATQSASPVRASEGEALGHKGGERMNADADATHPGFTVTCDTCGSNDVIVESDVGFSATSGAWGDVSLVCRNCDALTAIFETNA